MVIVIRFLAHSMNSSPVELSKRSFSASVRLERGTRPRVFRALTVLSISNEASGESTIPVNIRWVLTAEAPERMVTTSFSPTGVRVRSTKHFPSSPIRSWEALTDSAAALLRITSS